MQEITHGATAAVVRPSLLYVVAHAAFTFVRALNILFLRLYEDGDYRVSNIGIHKKLSDNTNIVKFKILKSQKSFWIIFDHFRLELFPPFWMNPIRASEKFIYFFDGS